MSARRRILLSWSSGKDSAWALQRLRRDAGVEVVGLLTTTDEAAGRVAMHAVRNELVRAQARSAGIPLREVALPNPCPDAVYEQRLGAAMRGAVAEGITAVAFGDLFLEDIRAYRERMLARCGLEALFPLWGEDTGRLARAMIDGGLRAVLTCVDARRCPPELAGRDYDLQLLSELGPQVDPCGENGEFHTFCHGGPMFTTPLRVRVGAAAEREGFRTVDLTPGDRSP